ncbi:hypothetical protein [Blastococcus brunescens]|uniref:Uncharacterized protein n=1 Tax=Blastococcus brunescens TaxID=1564165 RepID=A0ABZ1AXK6_9ACTN|nr:hypothetical protein [Blastococcus sp. BMG 8361]WRL62236.1 hypothetical protein U6N30_19615 [Blastococcus sp. BMG 8361]
MSVDGEDIPFAPLFAALAAGRSTCCCPAAPGSTSAGRSSTGCGS